MLNKVFLSLFLSFGMSYGAYAQANTTQVENNRQKVVLKDLDFKTVMMAFYQKEIQFVKIPELDHEKLQYVGIKNDSNDSSVNESGVLIFSPAQSFINADNEARYLLSITKFDISGLNLAQVEMGKFRYSETSVYIFKKNDKGQFQLLSEIGENLLNDDFVYLPYSSDKIIHNIRDIGPKIKGYVEENENSQEGYSSTKLKIMPFDDQTYISTLEVAEIDLDNEISNDENKYNLKGKYKFLKSEHDGLYDIEIQYSGTKKLGEFETGKIVPMNETHIYQYNAKQQKYIRVK